MTQTFRNEFTAYLRRLGQHINIIYDRLKRIETKVDEISEEIAKIKNFSEVDRREFNEFVNRLTESLKELLPPIPEEPSNEASTENDQILKLSLIT